MTDQERITQLEKDVANIKQVMVLQTEAMQKLLEHVRLTAGY